MEEQILDTSLSDSKKLSTLFRDDLSNRSVWESRQRRFYEMRHRGIRRLGKPWPSASDSHIPIADTEIERLKPYFYGQIFTEETVVNFSYNVHLKDLQPLAESLERWFDYECREQSNLEYESFALIDCDLQHGVAVMKTTWDADGERLNFDSIDPIYIVVPNYTKQFDDTLDRILHIQNFSRSNFRSAKQFDEKFRTDASMDLMTTSGDELSDNEQVKYEREGLTYDKKLVVVWEQWERITDEKDLEDGFKWNVTWVSPQNAEEILKGPIKKEYNPMIDIPLEIKDKGFYSSRGLPERVFPEEYTATQLHNNKLDSITLYNQPMLYKDGNKEQNLKNLKYIPGQVLDFKIGAVQLGAPPISYDREMEMLQRRVERKIGSPNFAIGSGDDKTATETNEISQINEANLDVKGRVFRLSMARVYNVAWKLLKEHKSEAIENILGNYPDLVEKYNLDPTGGDLDKLFRIKPSGTSANWHRSIKLQKAMALRKQLYESPFSDQKELDKRVVRAYDATAVDEIISESKASKQLDMMLAQIAQQNPQKAEQVTGQLIQGLQLLMNPQQGPPPPPGQGPQPQQPPQ